MLEHVAAQLGVESYLEIGVQEGFSLLSVLRGSSKLRRLALCDTWGSEHGGTGRGSHRHIQEMLSARQYQGTVLWLDGSSRELLPHVIESFDLVHIDGDHTEEGTWMDLVNTWPLCSKALVIHDTEDEAFWEVQSAFRKFCQTVGREPLRFTGDNGTAVLVRQGVIL